MLHPHIGLVPHGLHAGRHSKGPFPALISPRKGMLRAGGDVVDVRERFDGRGVEAVGRRGYERPLGASSA